MSSFSLLEEHHVDEGRDLTRLNLEMHHVAIWCILSGQSLCLKGNHWERSNKRGYVRRAVGHKEKTSRNSCRSAQPLWFMMLGVTTLVTAGMKTVGLFLWHADNSVLVDIFIRLTSREVLFMYLLFLLGVEPTGRITRSTAASSLLHDMFVWISSLLQIRPAFVFSNEVWRLPCLKS